MNKILAFISKNKFKSIVLLFSVYLLYSAIVAYVALPGKIDYSLNAKYYNEIVEDLIWKYPEVYMLHGEGITFYHPNTRASETRETCKNRNLITNNESHMICDSKYDDLFDLVNKTNIIWVLNYNIDWTKDWQSYSKTRPDAQIQILTESRVARFLDTSYMYRKGFFKESISPSKKYIERINDDWAVYQEID